LCWYHTFDGGREWYTALGHLPEHYDDPVLMRHIYEGILWAMQGSKHLDYTNVTKELKME
jgi:type 1 glutamine amidotransferase